MSYSHLVIEAEIFVAKIQAQIASGEILRKEASIHEERYPAYKEDYNKWNEETSEILRKSFADEINGFLQDFRQIYEDSRSSFIGVLDVYSGQNAIKEKIHKKCMYLRQVLEILNVCDFIRLGDKFEKKSHVKMQDKLDVILDRLNKLSGGGYHEVKLLLQGNGIPLRSEHEPRQLVEILEGNGYVESLGGIGAEIQCGLPAIWRTVGRFKKHSFLTEFSTTQKNINV